MTQSKGTAANDAKRINAKVPADYADMFDSLSNARHPTYPRLQLGQEDLIRACMIALEQPELVAKLKLDLRRHPENVFQVIEAYVAQSKRNDNDEEAANVH